jgi:hypothetical protein
MVNNRAALRDLSFHQSTEMQRRLEVGDAHVFDREPMMFQSKSFDRDIKGLLAKAHQGRSADTAKRL